MTMILPPDSPTPIGARAEVKKELLDLAFQDSHHVKMLFYPKAWADAPETTCDWSCSDFPPVPRDSIPKGPGVYVFVVMTNIFNFPHGNGLFYIGKTTNLYERIGSYIAEIDRSFESSKRPWVWKMINSWRGHLKYFYTTTLDVKEAEELESHMLNAFRPPFNRQYEASISQTMRAFSMKTTTLLPSIRSRVGDWSYYVTTLSFEEVNLLIRAPDEIHERKKLADWIQREAIEKHADAIATYIINIESVAKIKMESCGKLFDDPSQKSDGKILEKKAPCEPHLV